MIKTWMTALLALAIGVFPAIVLADPAGSATGGTAGTQSWAAGCVYTASLPTLANGQQVTQQCNANGIPFVAIASGGGTGGTASTFGAAFPATGTAIGATSGGNMIALGGKPASTSAALTDPSLVVAQSPNPAPVCTSVLAINQTSSTDLKTMTNFGYICSIVLVSASQQQISLIEGTGSVCAAGTTALIGGAAGTVAVAANGGFSSVAASPWLKMAASADHLCLIQSGAGNVSGVITYQDHA